MAKYGTGIVIRRGSNNNDITWPTGHNEPLYHGVAADICRVAGIREDKHKRAERRARKLNDRRERSAA